VRASTAASSGVSIRTSLPHLSHQFAGGAFEVRAAKTRSVSTVTLTLRFVVNLAPEQSAASGRQPIQDLRCALIVCAIPTILSPLDERGFRVSKPSSIADDLQTVS